MEELEKYIEKEKQKEKQKEYLNLFMLLTELSKKENIISFTYNKYYLTIQTGVNDYYRIKVKEV